MKDDLKLYFRQYKSISRSLVRRGQLDEYTRCSWSVKGLTPVLSEKSSESVHSIPKT